MAGTPGTTTRTPGAARRDRRGPGAADGALQHVVDALAARLGRSVAIDDPGLRLVAASAHFGDEDAVRVHSLLRREIRTDNRRFVLSQGIARWATPGRLAASPDFDAKARLCLPLRHGGVLLGYLWLIDPEESLTEGEIAQAKAAGRAAEALLHRRVVQRDDARHQQQALLEQVLSPDAGEAAGAWRHIQDHRLLGSPAGVAVLVAAAGRPAGGGATGPYDAGDGDIARSCAVSAVRDLAPGAALVGVREDRAVLLLSAPLDGTPALAAAVARRVVARVDLPGAPGCVVGVGPAGSGLDGVRSSYGQACDALRVGQLLPQLGPVVDAQRAGVYPLLLRLLPAGSAADLPDCVVRLLHDDPSGKLARTAETYLDEAGDAQRAAARLQVHRTTLYYRLGRVEDVAGVDLASGEARLALHMGLRLARLAGALQEEEHWQDAGCGEGRRSSPR